MEETVWKEHDLQLVEREPRPVIDVSYVELPEKLTYRFFNASTILGTAAILAMIAATGAGDNLLLGLLFTAIFAGCTYLSIKEDGKKDRLHRRPEHGACQVLKNYLCIHYTGAGRKNQWRN